MLCEIREVLVILGLCIRYSIVVYQDGGNLKGEKKKGVKSEKLSLIIIGFPNGRGTRGICFVVGLSLSSQTNEALGGYALLRGYCCFLCRCRLNIFCGILTVEAEAREG